MAYQTISVSNQTDYIAAINNFAVANGWTLTSGVLSKAGVSSQVQLTNPSGTDVFINAGRGGVFTGPDTTRVAFKLTTWLPSMQLEMFYFANPDTFWFTLNWKPGFFLHSGFGSIAKYGTWTGGLWIHGQHADRTGSNDDRCFSLVDGSQAPFGNGYAAECGLFWGQSTTASFNGLYLNNAVSKIHCELRGYIWENGIEALASVAPTQARVEIPLLITPIHKTNPNTFNGQTILTPFELFLQNTDLHYMGIGNIGHMRYVRLVNYNPKDIVTIGTQRWKIYPWCRKDPANPDGITGGLDPNRFSTGLNGFAVRYDGP